ncbi:MAG: DUF5320 domain-containing protein [Desulfovibrionaceae bacterium]|nr:DUF5320 domain-containing protein [Desulfovibrionaceae bacterium]
MPGMNGSGPLGQGPRTGRGMGRCGVNVQPDAPMDEAMNAQPGVGMGMGRGLGPCGGGMRNGRCGAGRNMNQGRGRGMGGGAGRGMGRGMGGVFVAPGTAGTPETPETPKAPEARSADADADKE